MLAGGDDAPAADVPADAVIVAEVSPVVPAAISAPVLEASSSTVIEPVVPAAPTAPATYNPYAYLSYLSADKTDGAAGSSTAAEDMEKQLEAFLEQTAQAAAAADTVDKSGDEGSHSDSEHSGSESGSESEHSRKSRSRSKSHSKSPVADNKTDKNTDKDKDSGSGSKSAAEERAAMIKRLDEMNKPTKADVSAVPAPRPQRKSGGSPSRRRSYRSRSKSRRSRSRSRSRRHRRKRSSSRSRHSGSKRRRRSGSRHRKRSHRSRSPRHGSSRHRSSRHKRSSRRRSGSREKRRDPNRKPQYAHIATPSTVAPAKPEDFKSRMKRELQQAAKDAMEGKGTATPQEALLRTMAAMHAKAEELTGVAVPKFYNPAAINPLKFAEQQQKRKLLWSKAAQNKEHTVQKFQGSDVVADEKYRKLMGIKGDVQLKDISEEEKQKQSDMFARLDQEYALARITTHTHRGMGLGVVSSMAAQSANEQFNKP